MMEAVERLPAEELVRSGLADAIPWLLADALEQSSAAIVITSDQGKIEYANRKFGHLFGHCSEDIIGADISALSEEPPEVKEDIWRVLATGQEWRGDIRSKRKNGEYFRSHAVVSPVRNAEGAVTHFMGVHEEIPDCRRAEEPAGQAEDPASAGDGAVPDYVVVADPDGTILFTSESVLGITREEATGASVFQFVSPEHSDRLKTYLEEVARTGKAVSYEMAGIGPRGTTSIYTAHLGPIKRGGEVVALSLFASDVSEGRRIEETLQESESRLRALSEAGIEAIAIHDKGEILDANPALAAMFGYDLSEVIGMHATKLTAPEDRERLMRNIVSGLAEPYEALGLRKDGTTFHAEVCGKNMLYKGRMVRVTAIRDITARRRQIEPSRRVGAQRPAAGPRLRGETTSSRTVRALDGERPDRGQLNLSGRELEVLALLAQGLTNRELGERLELSPRTIGHHVSHILRKLHVSNRTSAVAAAGWGGLIPAKKDKG